MEPIEQLRALVKAQEFALRVRAATEVIAEAPDKIEKIEAEFRERNAEYVAVRERHDEVIEDQKTRQLRVKELEEARDKFKQNLMQVKNQREYAAVLQEIDTVESEISGHEDAILKDMEEMETLKEELKTHEEHIAAERKKVAQDRTDVEKAVADAEKAVAKFSKERDAVEAALPDNLVSSSRGLEQTRQGVFLAQVSADGTCAACYVRIRPQMIQEIKRSDQIHSCGSCKRFLYHETIVVTPKKADTPAESAGAQPTA